MKSEKRRLIEELLDDGQAARRQKTLSAGGQILRRRRWRRAALRSFALVALIGVSALFIRKSPPAPPETVTSSPAAPSQPKSLTDEELLALFPNTPVALAKLDDGRKRLIFPRSGDEQKFITRL